MSEPDPKLRPPTKASKEAPTNMGNPNANADNNGSPPTTDMTPTDRTVKAVVNPYTVKKSKAPQVRYTDINIFINAVDECINILVQHDSSLTQEPWHLLWQSWIDEGILEKPTLHMVSAIVELPPTTVKSNRAVGEFILQKSPLYRVISKLQVIHVYKLVIDKGPAVHDVDHVTTTKQDHTGDNTTKKASQLQVYHQN